MKKKISVIIISLFSFGLLSSFLINNVIDVNPKVLEYFGNKQVEDMQVNNPKQLQYWNYYVENSFYIVDYPEGKVSTNVNELVYKSEFIGQNIDLVNLNILKFDVEQITNGPTYYRISSLNKLLIMYPKNDFEKDFEKTLIQRNN